MAHCAQHNWIAVPSPDGRVVVMCNTCLFIAGVAGAVPTIVASTTPPIRIAPSPPSSNPPHWPIVIVHGSGGLTVRPDPNMAAWNEGCQPTASYWYDLGAVTEVEPIIRDDSNYR